MLIYLHILCNFILIPCLWLYLIQMEILKKIPTILFQILYEQRDAKRHPIYKKRRCFLWNNQYFHLDIYKEPNPERWAMVAQRTIFTVYLLKNVIVMVGNKCFAERICVILNRRISIMLNIFVEWCFLLFVKCAVSICS